MELQQIKKEVQGLPHAGNTLTLFKENWIKPIKGSSNNLLPFLRTLSPEIKASLNEKIGSMNEHVQKLENVHKVQEKLQLTVRQMIEYKLAGFQGDVKKSQMLSSRLLSDDFFSLPQTIAQMREIDHSIKMVETHYQEITALLHKSLSLEEALFFMQLPHQKYLQALVRTQEKQKGIVRDLGRHFVAITEQFSLRKMPLR